MNDTIISFINGDIFDSAPNVQALVCPVNCEGVMGAGLALEFKKRYPEYFNHYKRACKTKELTYETLDVFETPYCFPDMIISFPTKDKWRDCSNALTVHNGIRRLAELIKDLQIESISIPALGCGLGKLDWKIVRADLMLYLHDISNCQIDIYNPK